MDLKFCIIVAILIIDIATIIFLGGFINGENTA